MKRKRRHHGRRLIIILLSLTFSTFTFLSFISQQINSTMIELAKSETANITQYIINKSISDLDFSSDFINTSLASDGRVMSVDFNSDAVNFMLTSLVSNMQTTLSKISSGNFTKQELFGYNLNVDDYLLSKGIIYQIPISLAFKNVFLAETGPRIPVRFRLIGDIGASVAASITNYGINNVLIEVVASIKVRTFVYIPYLNQATTINTPILLGMKMISGEIPLVYQGSYGINTGISLPLE